MNNIVVSRGDIFWAEISLTNRLNEKEIRPVLVIQYNVANKYSNDVIVIPISSNKNKNIILYPSVSLEINGIIKNVSVLTNKITSIEKKKLKNKIGHIDDASMKKVSKSIIIIQGLVDDYNDSIELEKSIKQYEKELKSEVEEKFYELNSKIDKEEDWENEFKEFNNQYDKNNTIFTLMKKKVPEFVCSILNSEKNSDGKIFFGVTDSGIIKGIYLSEKDKDTIKRLFYDVLNRIVPKIQDKSSYDINFIRLKEDDKIKENFYVIECIIPHSLHPEILYFNGNKLHIRLNGRKETKTYDNLAFVGEIQSIIRDRIYKKILKEKK